MVEIMEGELKKLLAERTGLHHLDQKIMYKNKERDSSAFLDICGVKDKSKLVMMFDPTAQATRLLEVRKAVKLKKATNAIKDIRTEVDKLESQLIKLDGIIADGDLKIQRGMQVRRVQKYVETVDVLKVKNEKIATEVPKQQKQRQPSSMAVIDEWETFDSLEA